MSKITSEQLFEAIGETKKEYLKEISYGNISNKESKKKKKVHKKPSRFFKIASAAACLALLVLGVWSQNNHSQSEYNQLDQNEQEACCSMDVIMGKIVDDTYYYSIIEDGIYAYDIEERTNEKIIDAKQYEYDYRINSYGMFYSLNQHVYMREHKTGDTKIVFSVEDDSDTKVYFDYNEETLEIVGFEDIRIEIYDYDKEIIYERILDGRTGEDITEQYPNIQSESMSFDEDEHRNETHTYQIGDREFRHEIVYALEEDGIWRSKERIYEQKNNEWQQLWPRDADGKEYYSSVEFANKDMLIVNYEYYMENTKVVYLASGKNVILPYEINSTWISAIVDDYIFYHANTQNGLYKPMVYDLTTGESWQLKCFEDMECKKECSKEVLDKFYSYITDGDCVISSTGWLTEQILWKMNYDKEKRPISVSFVTTFDTEK